MCRPPQIKLNSEARFKSTQKEITPRHSFRPAQTTHSKDLPTQMFPFKKIEADIISTLRYALNL